MAIEFDRMAMNSDDDDEVELQPRAPPMQWPAPKHPSTQRPPVRLDHAFLNPNKAVQMAHSTAAAPVVASAMHSTRRLEAQIQSVQEQRYDERTIELDDDERRELVAQTAPAKGPWRYDYDALVDVDAPPPVKPRKVKKQIDDKWKQSLAVAPPRELPSEIDFQIEDRIRASAMQCFGAPFDAKRHMAAAAPTSTPLNLFLGFKMQ
ncbi:hypothetical protein SPRG_00280 [Saprolegnia parasitica CBS 223.65]|uniref:Uncharacterized protein n=1 Tax=Saprolegnia parasitica (strain CBS 223.65) TaxID=695850 RepID=A0A067D8U4_SAPPC|nr:hypothetical protein SPRG_00280 [Saprolegnia parasitica CBS 223.65]KDO35432.1 hypothetical protein SPRG_00280 [Saprolegnia parasitica CBS 223.65]|eukprot:XP_012193772.1 hypothetical protein SPRG_00280 [Saprolegnia parasitica CBS 223.65]